MVAPARAGEVLTHRLFGDDDGFGNSGKGVMASVCAAMVVVIVSLLVEGEGGVARS